MYGYKLFFSGSHRIGILCTLMLCKVLLHFLLMNYGFLAAILTSQMGYLMEHFEDVVNRKPVFLCFCRYIRVWNTFDFCNRLLKREWIILCIFWSLVSSIWENEHSFEGKWEVFFPPDTSQLPGTLWTPAEFLQFDFTLTLNTQS